MPPSGPVTSHVFRLQPNAQLKESLCECASIIFARSPRENSSLFVMTVVGSLKGVKLRLANAQKPTGSPFGNGAGVSSIGESNEVREWKDERFEIISVEGTFCRDGSCHLHVGIADARGNSFGGHLLEATVFTTAEVGKPQFSKFYYYTRIGFVSDMRYLQFISFGLSSGGLFFERI